jgi:ATPase subunit of ABC transporter with duplicated ATPase domains
MISKMMLSGANVLLFDQPTNHLDLESIAALNNGMEAFPHNIIFYSHDHQLTQTVANRIIELTEDGCIDRSVTYDEYMDLFGRTETENTEVSAMNNLWIYDKNQRPPRPRP